MANYYQKDMECASREEMVALQNERLVEQVKHVWENVPYYRKKMEEKGVTPEDIKGIDDLYKLPFLTKDDLREAYPYGLLGADLKDCVRIHSTSGTTGKQACRGLLYPARRRFVGGLLCARYCGCRRYK